MIGTLSLELQEITVDVMELALHIMDPGSHHRHFKLCFYIYLIVQVCFNTVFGCLSVLAHQHENGEKDGLKRDGHGQKLKGKRVKLNGLWPERVGHQPDHKDHQVEQEKGDRAGELSNDISYALSQRDMFIDFFIGIAANPCSQDIVGMLETLPQLRQDVNGRFRSSAQEIKEFITLYFQRHHFLLRGTTGSSCLPSQHG